MIKVKERMFAARPVADWLDVNQYPKTTRDSLRWEFLRRHPQYQLSWKHEGNNMDLAEKMFGLAMPMPDPFHPYINVPIVFGSASRQANNTLNMSIDVFEPLEPQFEKIRKGVLHARTMLKKAAPSVYGEKLNTRYPQKHDFVRDLRALDAYATGASYGKIAKTLNKSLEYAYSEYGRRYVEQAFAVQALITGQREQALTKK
jgi:hypothetical protein